MRIIYAARGLDRFAYLQMIMFAQAASKAAIHMNDSGRAIRLRLPTAGAMKLRSYPMIVVQV